MVGNLQLNNNFCNFLTIIEPRYVKLNNLGKNFYKKHKYDFILKKYI